MIGALVGEGVGLDVNAVGLFDGLFVGNTNAVGLFDGR